MSTFLSLIGPQPVVYPYPSRTRTLQSPLFHRTHFTNPKPVYRAPLVVAKFGFLNWGQLPDPDKIEGTIRELFGRAEGFLYTLADAAVSNTDAVTSSTAPAKQNGDWLSGITNSMEAVLKVLKDGLSALHVPYAYGFAIILLTVFVKAATFPLSKKQVESAMAMRSLQPQIKAIQERYAGDQEKIQLETARLYKVAGINPLAGCLPTLATIPVWIGLYRALSNVANEGLLTEGFFWIPSLAGPTTIAARQNGSGVSWLFPFVDGHPPLGWSDTAAYLVLPVLLVVAQYMSIQIMQSSQPNDPSVKSSQALTQILPLMIGYFSLSVPSGLSLYWLTNNILSTAQQVWLQKMGGAQNPLGRLNDDTFKKEQSQAQKYIFETKTSQTETKSIQSETKSSQKEEISPSTGLRRGERFKQLKELETRKMCQREEEKIRTQEAATKAASMTKDGHDKQGNIVDPAQGTAAGSVDAVSETDHSATFSNSSNGITVNGNVHGVASKEHDNKSDLKTENSSPIKESKQQLSEEDLRKEGVEAHNRLSSMDQSSGKETS